MHPQLNRRQFIGSVAASLAGAAFSQSAFAAKPAGSLAWQIGGLTRPWSKWTFDEMLAGVQGAGLQLFGFLTPTQGDTFLAAGGSPEYIQSLKRSVAAKGLTPIFGRMRTSGDASGSEARAELREQIDNAKTLGLRFVAHLGVTRPEQYEPFYRYMKFAAAYAQDAGIQLITKPHGGVTASAADLQRCLEEVNHPNFKIWYDAGNILYYTGKDPVTELKPIASEVTGFFAKDCTGERGEVMIQFGTGKVDFPAVFRTLKGADFNGPIMIESSSAADSAEETTANVRANREYLERAISRI